MKKRFFAPLFALLIAGAACNADPYAATLTEINQLLKEDISMSAEVRAKVVALRDQGEQLHKDGKTKESLEALRQARQILKGAQDADLLRKNEG
jgi:hypothetical protein